MNCFSSYQSLVSPYLPGFWARSTAWSFAWAYASATASLSVPQNSGVMLIDLDRCRQLCVFDRSRKFLAEHPDKVHFWDQDALNWAIDDNWQRLARR